MISISALTKRYGRTVALSDVDLTVEPGSSVALWGANGAGKTTVLLCTLGLVSFSGSIRVDGHDAIRSGKQARARIGYVPQRPDFDEYLTVVEVLRLSAALRGLHTATLERVIDATGLEGLAHVMAGALSGGTRQRLALAVALLADPPVLLLDEPLANLDVAARAATLGVLQGLRGPERTLLVTSHHLEEVSLLVDRVVLMEGGRVVDDCTPAELPDRIGLTAWLHLTVDPAAIPRALEVLAHLGHTPSANGHGVLVSLPPEQKATAVTALVGAGIAVHNVEVWR